jgi:phage shock protein PspC (stress-responsive transcriptional regulator)
MKNLLRSVLGLFVAVGASIPGLAWASGGAATNLVVVADTRRVSGILQYIANVYNTDPWLFAVWAVVITAVWGAILGLLMDFIMERTGLDLRSRKIIEH